MKHATVHIGDMAIPLIGIPESETIERCDGCGKKFNLRQVWLDGTKFLCADCRGNAKPALDTLPIPADNSFVDPE